MRYAPAGWLLNGDGVGPQPRPESLQLRVEGADQGEVARAGELGLSQVVVLEHVADLCGGRDVLCAELVEGERPVGDRLAVRLAERGCELLAGQVFAGDA